MPANDTTGHCAGCAHFDDAPVGAAEAGLCRYNPPAPAAEAAARGRWPVVAATDWCGHYTMPRAGHFRLAAE